MSSLEASQESEGQFDSGQDTERGGPLTFCLLKIASMHGLSVSVDRLLSGLPLENDWLVPSCVDRAAARAGMTSRVVRAPLQRLNTALAPLILVLEGNGACVLLSVDRRGGTAQLLFPELDQGEATIPLKELEARYSGYAFYVKPVFRFDERAPSYHGDKGSNWFWSSISENRAIYRDVIAASAISNVFALAMPLFTMNVYNRIVPNRAMDSLWVTAIGVLIMITADYLLNATRSRLVDNAAARTNARLSALLMEQILALKAADRPPSVGSFANVIQGFESVRNFISSATLFAYVDLPFSFFFLAVIAIIAWPLAIPLAVGSLMILLHAALIQGTMRDLAETTNRASALKNATLIESLVGMETVKSQGAESHVQMRWERAVSFLELTNTRLRLLSGSVINGIQWVQQLVSVITMVVGVYLVVSNNLSMGALIAVSMLSSRCIAPVGKAAGLMMQYHSASRSLAALDDIMRKETERPAEAAFLSRPRLAGDLELQGVTFTYPGQERPALSGVSFRIARGERVALVGRVGSGKSTIGKLILGLHRPQAGTVLLDGADIRSIDPAEIRRNVASVPQDVILFFGTLKENLMFGNPPRTDVEILRAAEAAGVDRFANLHPRGFDMQVGERGEFLSSGQRQTIAVARALLKQAPVLLLDEPTASMDNATEDHVRSRLSSFVDGRTLLLVTHRTALLDLVDRIIVLDEGRVAADGPKEQVLSALYRSKAKPAKIEGGVASA